MKCIIKGQLSVKNVKKFPNIFSRERESEKKKKVPNNPNMILNSNGDIGKGKKMNDSKPKENYFHYRVF